MKTHARAAGGIDYLIVKVALSTLVNYAFPAASTPAALVALA
jgi:hypothetical protein